MTASAEGSDEHTVSAVYCQRTDGNAALSTVTPDKTNVKAGETVTLTVNTTPGEKLTEQTELGGIPLTNGFLVYNPSDTDNPFIAVSKEGDSYTFIMPDCDVQIGAYFECVDYAIGFDDLDYYNNHGTLEYERWATNPSNSELEKQADFSPAHVGDTIIIENNYIFHNTKYIVSRMYYSYTDENNVKHVVPIENEYTGTENVYFIGRFTMPAYDISIALEYQGAHSVELADKVGWALTRDKWSAVEGETVTLSVNAGYDIKSVTVKCGDVDVAVTKNSNGTYSFIMPDGDVEVSADYEHKFYYVNRYWSESAKKVVSSEVDIDPSTLTAVGLSSSLYTNGSDLILVTGDTTSSDRWTISGNMKLVLADGVTLTCSKGIAVNAGATLNIYGQTNDSGKLIANSDDYEAAIGSDDQDDDSGANGGGDINIYGGTIQATSGSDAAGIGGGNEAGNGNITIYGGTVTAQGGGDASGIGTGDEPETTAGNITIYGGTVTATGGDFGAGIGGGDAGKGGKIYIYGGTITSTGGKYGAGIGGGQGAVPSSIDIYGGTINAFGGLDATGIGAGMGHNSDAFTITIHDAEKVYAKGNGYGAGIGESADANTNSGYQSSSSTVIRIDGGTVEAYGGGDEAYVASKRAAAPGIGGGATMNTKCNIIITDGDVSAFGGKYTSFTWSADQSHDYYGAAGIGSGAIGNYSGGDFDGTIKIQGGTVRAKGSGFVHLAQNNLNNYFGAAGIGAGFGGNMRGTIEITGGTVQAEGVAGGSAIGAGSETLFGNGGECEGTVKISGGIVKLKLSSIYESDNSIIGHGLDGSEDGTLTLSDNLKVYFEGSSPVAASLRTDTCRSANETQLIIEPCDHPNKTYTSTSTTHTADCSYCNTSFTAQAHTNDANNKCTVCGYQGELYTVSFNADGGSGTMESVTVVPSKKFILPESGFTAPEGKRFKCWSVGGVEKAVGDEITVNANTEVKAVWENIFTVTFDTNGGNEIAAQTIAEGGKVTQPDNPTKSGFEFKGWQLNGSDYDFNSTVSDNITLTANWEELHYIDYIDENGESKTTEQSATQITSATSEIGSGWYFVDGTVSLEKLEYSGDVHLILTDGSKLYMSDFCENINGDKRSSIYSTDENGTLSIYGQQNGTGTIYAGAANSTTLDGELLYTYGALNIYGGKIESVKSGNCTIIAWQNVTMTNGDLKLKSQLSGKNALASLFGTLTISGGTVSASAPSYNAVFGDSIEISGGEVDASTGNSEYAALAAETDGSITITGGKVQARGGKGIWAKNINLGWTNKNSDSILSYAYTLDEGGALTLTKDFKKGNALYKSGEVSTSIKDKNNALIPAEVVTITFDKNNGTAADEVLAEKGNAITEPDAPIKDGYTFAGWYLNNEEYSFSSPVTEEITLTAKWEEAPTAELIEGNTVSFKDNLSLNFLAEIDDTLTDGAYVVFTYNHYGEETTKTVPLNANDKLGDYYRFRCELTASEMAIDVRADLYLMDSTDPVSTWTRNIRDYCISGMNSNDSSDKEKQLFRATLNYGGYTQKNFGYNAEPYANADYEDSVDDVNIISEVNFTKSTEIVDGIKYVGASVFLRNAPYVRYYFRLSSDADINDYTFKIGDNVIEPTEKSGFYYIESAPELAYQLDNAQNVVVTKNDTAIFDFNYSIIKWAEIAAASTTNTAERDMAKAMYVYYLKAKAFVNN